MLTKLLSGRNIIKSVITLVVFSVFSVFWLREAITLQHLAGFALIVAGCFLVFSASGS